MIIISGCIDKNPNKAINHVYEWAIGLELVQFLPPIPEGRSSFGMYYKYGERYIYVLGG